MELREEIDATIRRYGLLHKGERVVVGVSGGPDSLALLDLLQRIAPQWALHLHVAHLDHGLRPESAAEAEFVRKLAEQRGLPVTVERAALPASALSGIAVEETARRYRYAFLVRVATEVNATAIATGHNADDQAETVLMHLLRGSGLAGLRGMLPARPLRDYRLLPLRSPPPSHLRLIRPLLYTPRDAIEAYCRARGLRPRRDPSNTDTTFFRNRLRYEVLPYLEQITPRLRERLRHLAEVARADYDFLARSVEEAWEELLVEEGEGRLSFDLQRWRESHQAIRRALIRRAVWLLRPDLRDVSFIHVGIADRIAQEGTTGDEAVLPGGLRLRIGYRQLSFGTAEALAALPPGHPWLEPGTHLPLASPGTTTLPGGWRVTIRRLDRWSPEVIRRNTHPLTAWLDAEAVGKRPYLRTRQRGDRFHPQGMPRPVRLSDFLINQKVPRLWRDRQPLLIGDRGTIVWVIGHRIAEPARLHEASRAVLHITFANIDSSYAS